MTEPQYPDDLSGGGGSGAPETANDILKEAATRAKHIRRSVWAALAVLACLCVTMMYVVFNYVCIVWHSNDAKLALSPPGIAQPVSTASSPASASAPASVPTLASAPTPASVPTPASASTPRTDLAVVATSFTAITSVLVVALTVLAISLVKMSFQFASDRSGSDGKAAESNDTKIDSSVQLPVADMTKAVIQALSDALSAVVKGLPGGKS